MARSRKKSYRLAGPAVKTTGPSCNCSANGSSAKSRSNSPSPDVTAPRHAETPDRRSSGTVRRFGLATCLCCEVFHPRILEGDRSSPVGYEAVDKDWRLVLSPRVRGLGFQGLGYGAGRKIGDIASAVSPSRMRGQTKPEKGLQLRGYKLRDMPSGRHTVTQTTPPL